MPTLAEQFPWLRSEARGILGNPRPRKLAELIRSPIWRTLFGEWLSAYYPGYVQGFQELAEDTATRAEYTRLLEPVFGAFAHRRSTRPTLDGFIREATTQEQETFALHLRTRPPFPEAVQRFAALLLRRDFSEWHAALEPMVDAFGTEIGRLKGALQRGAGIGERRSARPGESGGPAQLRGDPAAARRPAQRAVGMSPPGQPGKASPPPTRPGVGGDVVAALEQQIVLAVSLPDTARTVAGVSTWLSGVFAACQGVLADEAASLQGFAALIEARVVDVEQHVNATRDAVSAPGIDHVSLFRALAGLRRAVYALAWTVDLEYVASFGRWPHTPLEHVAAALANVDVPRTFCYQAGAVLYRLATDTGSLYDQAIPLLDNTLAVVNAVVPGYGVQDGAVAWTSHETVTARASVQYLSDSIAAWPDPGEGPLDAALQDHWAQQIFSVSGPTFAGIVADLGAMRGTGA